VVTLDTARSKTQWGQTELLDRLEKCPA
jgi:hypothetical protein